MAYLNMLWNELLLFFNIGITIKIKVTMKCNLRCSYCCIDIADGRRATWEELNGDEWLQIVNNFPLKVRKVLIIGGEPFFYPHCVELIKKLNEKRIIVKAFTNGTYKRMLDIPPSPYYKIISTFHHEMNTKMRDHWQALHKRVQKEGYRILVNEVAVCELHGTQLMPLVTTNEDSVSCYFRREFIFMPNGAMAQCIEDACSFVGYQSKVNWSFSRPEQFYSIYQMKEKWNILFGHKIRSVYHKITGKKIKEW